jgi:hypothetical protein
MTDEKELNETVAEVQQIFDAEAKGGEPGVAPEYTPPEAATEAETKGEEKAVTTEPEEAPLLAGKYKTAEDLAKAYQELEKTYHATAAKATEQERELGVASKNQEAHKKFLEVVANADPENVQTAILQHMKETGQVAFDANVLDPKVGLHIASALNPIVQELRDGLAELRSGKNAEVEAEAKAQYEKEYPFMADETVQKTINSVAERLRAESPDGQLDGDKLVAETARIVREATLKEVASKAALESRTGAEAAATSERASDQKPAQSKGDLLVEAIFGNPEKGVGALGEIPPDII